ncbi:MAG: hypothetical protein VXZ96_00895 [Myxococcota bacterium]|nr:hypothetical protein [Myxococcota bacterium]
MVALLSILLGGYPLIPALLAGQVPGIGHTDLIPAMWSMWAFAQEFPSLGQTQLLGYPDGMGWYPQSLHSAMLGLPLQFFFSIQVSYTLCLWVARSLTFGIFYTAGRAWNMSISGAWLASLAIGLSPILFGYAYEGITEGVHAWPLGLWFWMLAKRSRIGIGIGFFLAITASWYLAAASCLILLFVFRQKHVEYSLLGLLGAMPLIWLFFKAFPEPQMIDTSIRQAHSISMGFKMPFWLSESQTVFGQSSYVSVTLLIMLGIAKRWTSLLLLVPIALGSSLPIISELPVLSAIRFPYRWQIATTVLAVMLLRERLKEPVKPWLILVLSSELIFASPFPPLLPITPIQQETIFEKIDGPVLNIPNLLSRPPGEYNPSKLRANALYSAQFQHHQPIMAVPSFNGLNHTTDHIPTGMLALDPYHLHDAEITKQELQGLKEVGLRYILVHRKQWPSKSSRLLTDQMAEIGYIPLEATEAHLLFDLETGP